MLNGYFKYPQGFNIGRSYYYTESEITAKNHLILVGYNYHVYQQKNLFFTFKLGGGFRQAKKYTYFEGYHEPNNKNLLTEPITNYFNEGVLAARIGIGYCFGYNAKINPISEKLKYAIENYFRKEDSLINYYFQNYQLSIKAVEQYKATKEKFLKRIPHYQTNVDTLETSNKFTDVSALINHEIFNKLMKPDAYKIIKTSKSGKIKTMHTAKDFYDYRKSKKFKPLYEKYRIN